MNVQRIEKESMNQEQPGIKPVIILASSSLNRRKILEGLEVSFKIIPPNIEEKAITAEEPRVLVQAISRQKAEIVTQMLPPINSYLIIAADSLVVSEGKILGKPAGKKEAIKMLCLLSDKTHFFYTGICIINTETREIHQECTESTVTFRKLAQEEIENYVNTQPVTTMAGGYDITKGSPGEKFLAKIEGSYTNVLGLPLENLFPVFEKYGIKYQDLQLTN